MRNDLPFLPSFPKYLVYAFILILASTWLVSCSSTTETKTGSLTGRIILAEGAEPQNELPNDFSGIQVALYELAVLDTAVARINRDHPTLGVIADQRTDFDHRFLKVVSRTTTDVNGNFSLAGFPAGTYNLVVFRENYGIMYKYNLSLGATENSLDSEITLHEENHLSGSYTQGNYVFSAQQNTVIDDDTQFLPGTSVIVEPGALIRVNPGKRISFYGQVKMRGTETNPFRITSNDRLMSTEQVVSIANYDRVGIAESATIVDGVIEYGYFNYNTTGLVFSRSFQVSNCIFKSSTGGIMAQGFLQNSSTAEVEKCNFYSLPGAEEFNVTISSYVNVNFTGNILANTARGLSLTAAPSVMVSNNSFQNRVYGVYIHSDSALSISHNLIHCSDIGIYTYNSSTLTISYNTITASTGIRFGYVMVNATISNNNLICSDKTVHATTWGGDDINAANNYWGTTDTTQIDQSIIDKHDFSPTTHINYDILAYVLYQPLKPAFVNSAGIQD
ncbi:hypothetical protein MASR1M36_19080 [Candidatus Cloacimonadaceae bacterium]